MVRRCARPVFTCLARGFNRFRSANLLLLLVLWQLTGLRTEAQDYSSISLQLPVARAGHTFTLRQQMPDSGAIISRPVENSGIAYSSLNQYGNVVLTANSYLEATGEIHLFGSYYLVDETTGETSPPNLLGTPSFERTSFLTTPWYSNGEVSSDFFLVLPEARASHVLSLYSQGASYILSNSPSVYYRAAGTAQTNWQPSLVSYGFFEARTPTSPSGPYRVVDHSTNEQSNTHQVSNRNLVADTFWGALSEGTPSRLVRIWLPQAEAHHSFTLHTGEGSVTWFSTPKIESGFDEDGVWHTNQPVVTAGTGGAAYFWLNRDLDGAQYSGMMEGDDRSFDASSSFPPYVPPQDPPSDDPPSYQPNFQTVAFPVGENHWGHTIVIQQGDGSYVYPAPDWSNQGSQTATDSSGNVYYTYSFVQYSAVVDVNLGDYIKQDDQGHTEFMDGFNPPYVPPPNNEPPTDPPAGEPPTFTMFVMVGENHWNETISFVLGGYTYLASPDWSTASYQAAYDAYGIEYYRYQYVTYTAIAAGNDQNYSVASSAGTTNFMDGWNPTQPANYQYYSFQVGENHWQEQIYVYLANGSRVEALPDPNTYAFNAAYDYLGIEYFRYSYVTYVAAYDANKGGPMLVSDSGGHTNFMDGITPPPAPEPPSEPGSGGPNWQTVSVLVGNDFWGESILAYSGSGQVTALSPDMGTYGFQAAYDVNGIEYYRYEWVTYTAYIDISVGYSIASASGATNFYTGFNPPEPPGTSPTSPPSPQPLQLKIAASRCQHALEIRTSGGVSHPVYPNQMEGFWTSDQRGKTWFTSYYFFTANCEVEPNQNWWVVDTTSGDQSEPNQNDLSGWQAPSSGDDTDEDGLLDWYEWLIGTASNESDTDGDGLPDLYEIQNGLNPTSASDAAGDADGDGRSNWQEYLDETDPQKAQAKAVVLKISSSRGAHNLAVVTASGERFPLSNVQEAGTSTSLPGGGTSWVSSGYFTASSFYQSGQDWHLNDATTQENGPTNTADLSNWEAPSGGGSNSPGNLENDPNAIIFTSFRSRSLTFTSYSGPVFPVQEITGAPDRWMKIARTNPSSYGSGDGVDGDAQETNYEHDDPRDQIPREGGAPYWTGAAPGEAGAKLFLAENTKAPAPGAPVSSTQGATYRAENAYQGSYKVVKSVDVPTTQFSLGKALETVSSVSYGGKANFPENTQGEGWQGSGREGPKSYEVSSSRFASGGMAVNPAGGGQGAYTVESAVMNFKEVRLESNVYLRKPVSRTFFVVRRTDVQTEPPSDTTYQTLGSVRVNIDSGKLSTSAQATSGMEDWITISGGVVRVVAPVPERDTVDAVSLVPVEILDKDKKALSKLKIAKMEEPGVLVVSGSSVTLNPERDSDRFYIRIPGGAGFGPSTVTLATIENPDGGYNDDPTEIDFQVEGADLITKSMLLVSDNVDDDYKVDGIADDVKNDRTHKVQLGGEVQINGLNLAGAECQVDVRTPVPVEKTVKVHAYILQEGMLYNTPVVDAAIVESDMKRVQERFAQCQIKIEYAVTTVASNPAGVTMNGFGNGFDSPDDRSSPVVIPVEAQKLFGALSPANDVIPIYYVNFLQLDSNIGKVSAGKHGIATAPVALSANDIVAGYQNRVLIQKSHTIFTAPHELMHVLLNAVHSDYSAEFKNSTMLWHPTTPNTISGTKRISTGQSSDLKAKTVFPK